MWDSLYVCQNTTQRHVYGQYRHGVLPEQTTNGTSILFTKLFGETYLPKQEKPGEFLCHTIFEWDIQVLRNAK